MKIKILRPYLDFEVGKPYDIKNNDLGKYLVAMRVGKEVVAKNGKVEVELVEKAKVEPVEKAELDVTFIPVEIDEVTDPVTNPVTEAIEDFTEEEDDDINLF